MNESTRLTLNRLKVNLSKLVKGDVTICIVEDTLVVNINHKEMLWRYTRKDFNYYCTFFGDSVHLTNEIVSLYRKQIVKTFFK